MLSLPLIYLFYYTVYSLHSQTCQQAVVLQPCNSRALYRLGDAQLRCHDNDDPNSSGAKQILQDAELSYRASIEQEGKPSAGMEASSKLTQQQWHKERMKKQEAEKKTVAAKTPQKADAASAGKGALPPGRGGTQAARGRVQTLVKGHLVEKRAVRQNHNIHYYSRLHVQSS